MPANTSPLEAPRLRSLADLRVGVGGGCCVGSRKSATESTRAFSSSNLFFVKTRRTNSLTRTATSAPVAEAAST
eukprot:2333515-Prymnesium_polylepis.1